MNFFSILVVAVGLSMDSFAVSIANGLCQRKITSKQLITITSFFAVFQALMPLLGWFLGSSLDKYVNEFDHWVAFILLGFIGGKMIYEGLLPKKEECSCVEEHCRKELTLFAIVCQAFATSIDALAVGISFAVLDQEIVRPVLIIGIVTFFFAWLGLKLGKILGQKFENYVEIFGGLVLIGIGVKILIEHTLLS